MTGRDAVGKGTLDRKNLWGWQAGTGEQVVKRTGFAVSGDGLTTYCSMDEGNKRGKRDRTHWITGSEFVFQNRLNTSLPLVNNLATSKSLSST